MINIRSSVQTNLTGLKSYCFTSAKSSGQGWISCTIQSSFMLHFSAGLSALFSLSVNFTSALDVSVSKMAAISNQGCMCLLHIQESEFSVSHNDQANVLKCSLIGAPWSFGQDLRNPDCLSLVTHIKLSGKHSDILCPSSLWEDSNLPTSLSRLCCTLKPSSYKLDFSGMVQIPGYNIPRTGKGQNKL